MRKIVIAGGTGFIGSYIAERFRQDHNSVFIVSRAPEHVPWDRDKLPAALEGADVVINLAGKNVNCRHNIENRKVILESRIQATTNIGNALKLCLNPPSLWINASAIGVYRSSSVRPMTEEDAMFGTDFLADVVRGWEQAFFSFQLPATRQIALRTAVVLGRDAGALPPLVNLARMGVGGKQGDGRQFFSWVHIEDYYRALLFLMENRFLTGVVNCCSPAPVTNEEFMRSLRAILQVKIGVPVPAFVIRWGSKFMDMVPGLVFKSVQVFPKKLTDAGFQFSYPKIDLALGNLLNV